MTLRLAALLALAACAPSERPAPGPPAPARVMTADPLDDKMRHCPLAVEGAEVRIADLPGGVSITVTARSGAATRAIRERAAHIEAFTKGAAPAGVHGGGKGGGFMKNCPIVTRATRIEVREVAGGARIVVRPAGDLDVAALRAETRRRHLALAKPSAAALAEMGRAEGETRLFSAEVAHLTGDDRVFLVVGGFTSRADGRASRVPILAPAADGSWRLVWEASWKGGAASIIRNVEVADLDGDGRDEIVALGRVGEDTKSCAGQLKILAVKGEELVEIAATTWKDGRYAHGYGLALGDLDGDGRLEIAGAGFSLEGGRERGDLRVWSLRGGKLVLRATALFADDRDDSMRVNAVAIADVDGDGKPEILTGGRHGARKARISPAGEEQRSEEGTLAVWSLQADELVEQSRFAWKKGSTTRIRSVRAVDVDGDGKHEVLVAGQCDAAGRACLALLRRAPDGSFVVASDAGLEAVQGEIKDILVMGSGADLRVVTAGPVGAKPSRQAQVQLWRLDAAGLRRERSWVSKNGDETRARAIAVWPSSTGPKLLTVGHALDGKQIVGQLLDWGATEP